MAEKNNDKDADDRAASARVTFPALDNWIRTYCGPGTPDAAAADYARTGEAAALADLKRLLSFGAVVDFVELSATYCIVSGGDDEPDPS